jgi:soluble lytic murein transglycosylase-like protein
MTAADPDPPVATMDVSEPDLSPLVSEAARRFGIAEGWIGAVMRAESGGRAIVAGKAVVSPAGAVGPMQLMPDTFRALSLRYGLGNDPADPEQNILAGAAYLRELYDRYGLAGMLAAYNAGPARYEAYRDRGLPLPAETRRYLETLKDLSSEEPTMAAVARAARLFFPLEPSPSGAPVDAPAMNSGPLFFPLDPASHEENGTVP